MQGVLKHCNLSGVDKIADIGGGFGHLAVGLLRKYEGLSALVVDVPELVPIAKERLGQRVKPSSLDSSSSVATCSTTSRPPTCM